MKEKSKYWSNPKKSNSARRVRPKGGSATHKEVWTEVIKKSQAGVEYVHFKRSIVAK